MTTKTTKGKRHPFGLTKPCADCPFRTDIRPYLRKGRIDMLEEDLRDKTFACHKTVNHEAHGSAQLENTSHCAGALILLEKIERPSRMMEIAERLGIYDRTKLDMGAPVFDSFDAMKEAQGE